MARLPDADVVASASASARAPPVARLLRSTRCAAITAVGSSAIGCSPSRPNCAPTASASPHGARPAPSCPPPLQEAQQPQPLDLVRGHPRRSGPRAAPRVAAPARSSSPDQTSWNASTDVARRACPAAASARARAPPPSARAECLARRGSAGSRSWPVPCTELGVPGTAAASTASSAWVRPPCCSSIHHESGEAEVDLRLERRVAFTSPSASRSTALRRSSRSATCPARRASTAARAGPGRSGFPRLLEQGDRAIAVARLGEPIGESRTRRRTSSTSLAGVRRPPARLARRR